MDESILEHIHLHYQNIVEHIQVPIVLLDQNNFIQYINPAFAALCGYHLEDVVNQPAHLYFISLAGTSSVQSFSKTIRDVKMGRIKSEEWITEVIKKNGIHLDVRVQISHYDVYKKAFRIMALILLNGQPRHVYYNDYVNKHLSIGSMQSYNPIQHTSNQKQEELFDADLCRVFKTAGVMLFSLNEKGYISSMNPEARRLLKYEEDDPGRLLHMQDVLRLEEANNHIENEYSTQDGIKFVDRLFYMAQHERNRYREVRLTDSNGQSLLTLFSVSIFKDMRGRSAGFLCVALDITERKKQEEQLMATLDREKKLGDIKSRFVSIASHEFRTPLSTILSSALLAGKYRSAEDQHKRDRHLNRIISAVNTLNDILNDFLNAGKIEEGKISVKMSHVDLKELFGQTLHDIKANAKKGQVFQYGHEGRSHFVTDASLVRNMLINLISNAIKFSPENALIKIQSSVNGRILQFHVEDEGIGIEAQDMKHLTERFYRGANAVNIQGTGLGMHIVAKYVERLGGKMDCESELGKGTVFLIELPEGH